MAMRDMITTPPPGGFMTGTYVVRRYPEGGYSPGGEYIPHADVDLEVTSIDDVADTLAIVAHDLATGDGPFWLAVPDPTADTLPAPLSSTTPYYAIVVDVDTVKLALSRTLALASTNVDLTDGGVGAMPVMSNGFVIAASVQSLGNSEMRDLPEGENPEDVRTVYSVVELHPRSEYDDPDIIVLPNARGVAKRYRVEKTSRFGTLSGGHFVSTVHKIEVQ